MIPHILASRVNIPHAIHPDKARVILEALGGREALPVVVKGAPQASLDDDITMASVGADNVDRIWTIADGVMIVTIRGTLMDETGEFTTYSGETGYDGIFAAIRSASARRDKVRGVAFDIKSCGGMVSGLFPLAEAVASLDIPTIALVNDHAYSAAYAIASQCDEIVIAPYTGSVGSVGVVMTHVDQEAYLAKEGLKVTMIHAGARKIDGNSLEALPERVRSRFQADVDRLYGDFVSLVARGRGMTEAAVRQTEADTFDLNDAVDIGFADRIADPMTALAEFSSRLARADDINPSEGDTMTETPRASGGGEAVLDAQASAKLVADARAAGVAEGRDAVLAIMELPEAQGREAAAAKMAKQGASPEMAASLLAMIPVASDSAPVKAADASAGVDVKAVAMKAANDAVASLMDGATGTGIDAAPVASESKGAASEKFVAASFV